MSLAACKWGGMRDLAVLVLIYTCAAGATAYAQAQGTVLSTPTCSGRVYSADQVTRPAKIIGGPDLAMLNSAAANYKVKGRAVVDVVLCRTGHVSDPRIVQGLPFNLNQFVVAATGTINFSPAELVWHSVSQKMQLVFEINERGAELILPRKELKRLVEEVDVIGNRRLTKDEILRLVKTRPGESYDELQVTLDLRSLLATGNFDSLTTRVTTEDAPRGGVRVMFQVFELPLISDLKFDGLSEIELWRLLANLKDRRVELPEHKAFDLAKMKLLTRIIKESLASLGLPSAKVELEIQNPTATTVSLTFVISREND